MGFVYSLKYLLAGTGKKKWFLIILIYIVNEGIVNRINSNQEKLISRIKAIDT